MAIFSIGKDISVKLDKSQSSAINKYSIQLESGFLKYEDKICLCGSADCKETDIVVDRYGIHSPLVVCLSCSLPYVREFLCERSLNDFYKKLYRPIYSEDYRTPKFIYKSQINSGQRFKTLLEDNGVKLGLMKIVEIGCGPGGILQPFSDAGHECYGCDFDQKYMEYGISQGLKIYSSDFFDIIDNKNIDLVIMSHVLEHIANPIEYIFKLRDCISDEGYLLIEVPGLNTLHLGMVERFFQGVHLYTFYSDYLKLMFENLGFDIVYCDENSTAILKKKMHCESIEDTKKRLRMLNSNSSRNVRYINETVSRYNLGLNPWYYKRLIKICIIKILEKIGVKEIIKSILFKR